MAAPEAFAGFQRPTSNTTYTPNQFFDVVLRHGSRGAVRLVGYLLRRTLGWSDAAGKPREPRVVVSWRELEERAGIGHSSIGRAIEEAVAARYITCIRPGSPDRQEAPGSSACYTLRWDEREQYLKAPEAFEGFYAGNGNLTYIPNQFFDRLVPQEALAVVKVVGAVIRHTIGFQTGYGFRRQQVRLSITDLERITRLNRDSVRLALAEALRKGYLVRVEEGCFDKAGGQDSRAAVYGPRWDDGFGEALRKPVRHHSEKPHGDRSGNPHGLEITGNNKIEKRRPAAARPVEASEVVQELAALGFDEATLHRLVTAYPLERVKRQLAWLPRRNPRRSARGLLLKAIEEDWPEPTVELPQTPAVRFAAGFYAGWSGAKGEALAQPTANDVAAAEPYVECLQAKRSDPADAEGWGREFGQYARRAEPQRREPLCSLVLALRLHGDAFVAWFQEREKKAQRLKLVAAQREHRQRHESAYLGYLRAREAYLKTEQPAAYARFAAHEAKQRRFLEQSKLTDRSLAVFEAEEQRLTRLQLFFAADPEVEVLEFWGWDEQHNQTPCRAAEGSAEPPGVRVGADTAA